jgi:predicted transcriptional regulator
MSEAESVIMDVVWELTPPVSPNDVMEHLPGNKSWHYKTVATFLQRLMEKGILECQKKGKFNLYAPRVTKQEYAAFEIKTVMSRYQGKNTARYLISALFNDKISETKLDELSALLEKEEAKC